MKTNVIENAAKSTKDWVRVAAIKDQEIKELKKQLTKTTQAANACKELSSCIYGSPKFISVVEKAVRVGHGLHKAK